MYTSRHRHWKSTLPRLLYTSQCQSNVLTRHISVSQSHKKKQITVLSGSQVPSVYTAADEKLFVDALMLHVIITM